MTPDEIRQARVALGHTSYLSFARALGLSDDARKTCRRWELPADHRDAAAPPPYFALAIAALMAGLAPWTAEQEIPHG